MTTKENKYETLCRTVAAIVETETDSIAVMANTAAAIMEAFDFLWAGFYLVRGDCLVLGPFQGPVACTRIQRGKGVCGTAWEREESIVVPDVHKFPGHIACNSKSKSEIVVPVFSNGTVAGVLDIDSQYLDTFDNIDEKYLSAIANLLKLT